MTKVCITGVAAEVLQILDCNEVICTVAAVCLMALNGNALCIVGGQSKHMESLISQNLSFNFSGSIGAFDCLSDAQVKLTLPT